MVPLMSSSLMIHLGHRSRPAAIEVIAESDFFALPERHISIARPVRMLSSAASTIRRLLTASRM